MRNLLMGAGLPALALGQAIAAPNTSLPADCDRVCLYGYVERYLDALVRHDPALLPWSKDARFTENSVALRIGDGLWGTATGLGNYKLKFADPENGQVGFFGVVKETSTCSAFAFRMRV